MKQNLQQRSEHALRIVDIAAELGLEYFHQPDRLHTESKGLQDLVSAGDRAVETLIREQLQAVFPEDGIIGEEHGEVPSQSGYTWVIDPIDGTSNYVRGNPGWCVVLACVDEKSVQISAIRDPIANETYHAVLGHGATLNGNAIQCSESTSLGNGSTGVGMSNRVPVDQVISALDEITRDDGVFYRNGSGALCLAYVACNRLIGYCEPHMNAWDCIAALLLIEEAGGTIEDYDLAAMLQRGGRVIAACSGVYPRLHSICQQHFTSPAAG